MNSLKISLEMRYEIKFKSETDMWFPSLWKDSHNLGLERSQLSLLVAVNRIIVSLKYLAIIVVFPVNTVLGVAKFVSFDFLLCPGSGSTINLDGLDGLGLYQIDLDKLMLVIDFCTPCTRPVWGTIDLWICIVPIPNWCKGKWVTFCYCLLNLIRVFVWLLPLFLRKFSILSLDGLNQNLFAGCVLLDDKV